jgi:hypothetical protein
VIDRELQLHRSSGMLFSPQRHKSGRQITVHCLQPVNARMARSANRHQPARRVVIRPAMVDMDSARVRIRHSADLAVPAITLEDFVAVAGKAIARMPQASQASAAETGRPRRGLSADTKERALPWEMRLHRKRLYPITNIIGSNK